MFDLTPPKVISKTFYLIDPNVGGRQLEMLLADGWFIDSAQPLQSGIFYVLLKPNPEAEEDEPWK